MDRVVKYFSEYFDNISINSENIVDVYTSIGKEINSVKYGVGIYNRTESAVLNLKGKDVLDFLQRISTNDLLNLQPYYYASTLFTNEKGRLIDRTVLVRLEEEYFLVGSKHNDTVLNRWLNKYIITEDVKIDNRTGNYLILDIVGPQAESYLTLICGKEVDDLDNNKLHKVEIDNSVGYLLKKSAASGEHIYWLIAEIDYSETMFNYMLSHKSVFDLSMVGEKAFDYYRVLNKVPKKPNEINDNYNPHEAGLLKDVSFTKGCYIGQEIIARLDTYDKVQKNLTKVKINDIGDLILPVELYNNNNELVGTLTTMVKSFENNHYEGLAFIRKEYYNTSLELKELNIGQSDNKLNMKIVD